MDAEEIRRVVRVESRRVLLYTYREILQELNKRVKEAEGELDALMKIDQN
jgi:hypothetical protein